MLINWRELEYEFFVSHLKGGGDKISRNSNIHAPIFGADTESVNLIDRYEPQCFTLSPPESIGGNYLEYFPPNDLAIKTFLFAIVREYGTYLFEQGKAFIYFHNLEYDWLQLIKNDSMLLEITKIGVSPETDTKLFKLNGYQFILKSHGIFTGSAPHFTIKVAKGKESFELLFRDSFSFFPSSLAKVAKDLKLNVLKMERQDDLGLKDYRPVGDRNKRKQEFERYAKLDSEITRKIGEQIRSLHEFAGLQKIRASSPSYAIGLLYSWIPHDKMIVSGIKEPEIMQMIFNTYRGGRTGGVIHGKVENITVYDFHSSYPASMLSLPSFNEKMKYYRVNNLELENVLSILEKNGNAFVLVSGKEIDPEYPSLITTIKGKLTPIYGEFQNVYTTGVELFAGIKSGGLIDLTIHEMIVLVENEDSPFLPFQHFANKAYERKQQAEKNSVEYISAKLALNGAYGKLIESRNQTLLSSYDQTTYFPYIDGLEKDFGKYYYTKYIDSGMNFEETYDSIICEINESFDEETRKNMKWLMFCDYPLSGKVYGKFVVPAAASLITAISRARLLVAMKSLGAYYWDTDSVFLPDMPESEIIVRLQKTRDWLPANVRPVAIGDELGDLGKEIEKASGFLSGIKRYYLKDETGYIKYATHGIPALPRGMEENILQTLATGETFEYESKPKPLKAKESKTAAEIGSFQSKRFRTDFKLDTRLNWIQTDEGFYVGQIRPYFEQGSKPITDENRKKYLKQMNQLAGFDPIKEEIKNHGFIRAPDENSYFYHAYQQLPKSIKTKYFRKHALQHIDEFADAIGLTANDLINKWT